MKTPLKLLKETYERERSQPEDVSGFGNLSRLQLAVLDKKSAKTSTIVDEPLQILVETLMNRAEARPVGLVKGDRKARIGQRRRVKALDQGRARRRRTREDSGCLGTRRRNDRSSSEAVPRGARASRCNRSGRSKRSGFSKRSIVSSRDSALSGECLHRRMARVFLTKHVDEEAGKTVCLGAERTA